MTAYVVKDVPSETYPRFGSASLKLIISTVSSTTTLFGEKVPIHCGSFCRRPFALHKATFSPTDNAQGSQAQLGPCLLPPQSTVAGEQSNEPVDMIRQKSVAYACSNRCAAPQNRPRHVGGRRSAAPWHFMKTMRPPTESCVRRRTSVIVSDLVARSCSAAAAVLGSPPGAV